MRNNEQAVQDISSCASEFECDPFDHTNQTIRSLQSGITATDALAADFALVKDNDRRKMKEFVDERVYSKTKSLNDRVPHSKLKNFSTQNWRVGI